MIGETENIGSYILELNARDKAMSPPALKLERPNWESIEIALKRAFQYGGYVRLRVLKPELAFTNLLEMVSLPGQFKLTALTKYTDPKDEHREWWEPGDAEFRGTVRFGDDDWDARMVSCDLAVAKELFWDLFLHGELTEVSLTQMRSVWNPKP